MKTTIIFGGTGFVGIHYTRKILLEAQYNSIILADFKDIQPQFMFSDIRNALDSNRLHYIYCDVRNYETFSSLPKEDIELIANFAAIHREPGHAHHEYFNTNIPGANNVCRYAQEVNCHTIVFTSSIAIYEPTELPKDEDTIPAPISAYGSSKLAAELVHQKWHEKDPNKRKLVIVRPGVVYGPSEGGNVTRMIKMIKKRMFVFIGNKDTRKASIYVKELINIIEHLLNQPEKFLISNAVVPTPPSMIDYVKAVNHASGWKRKVFSLPYYLVYVLSFFITIFAPPLAKKTGINPVRVKKLRRVNNIITRVLPDTGYVYNYTLESAFADWYNDNPTDW